jgi:hypothetical protein
MADVGTAWKQAGEQLSGLGLKLKLHYDEQRGDADGEQVRAQDEVKEAVRKLGAALQDAVDAMGAAARDQAVKDDVREVGRSLKDALGVTFAEISDELGKAFDRGRPKGQHDTAADSPYDSPEYGTPPEPGPGATTPPPTPSPAVRDREPGDPTPDPGAPTP